MAIGRQALIGDHQVGLELGGKCVAVMGWAHGRQILAEHAFHRSPALEHIPAQAARQAQVVGCVDID